MKAIVIATDNSAQTSLLNERYPNCLFPILDRPLLQHIVEYLVEKKVTEMEFVLHHFPEKIESLLGDGTRWGANFTFHLAKTPEESYKILTQQSQTVLLVSAETLPAMDFEEEKFTAYFTQKTQQWCGWAILPEDVLKTMAELTPSDIPGHIQNLAKSRNAIQEIATVLNTSDYQQFLESNQIALRKDICLLTSGREIEAGIWISRNVSLHPTARLTAPVYIGANCRIGESAEIGPNVVIGEGCILENQSHAKDAIIFPKSYIGEALELNKVIVDKNRLVNVEIGAALEITDNFILGSISDKSLQRISMGVISRVLGALGLLLFLPFTLCVAAFLKLFRRTPLSYKKQMVKLPATVSETQWETFDLHSFCDYGKIPSLKTYQHFLLCLLPALPEIAKGNLRFVGVPPRSQEEILELPQDWRSLYLNTKAGIINEYFVYKRNISQEDFYAADAFYAVAKSFRHDCKLIFRYLWNLFTVQ